MSVKQRYIANLLKDPSWVSFNPTQKAANWFFRMKRRAWTDSESLLDAWKKKFSEKEKVSKKDFATVIGESIPADADLARDPAPSLSEIGFLDKMIKGSFNGFSETSFTKASDKHYFKIFNSLSQEEKVQKYKDLENQINEFALRQ